MAKASEAGWDQVLSWTFGSDMAGGEWPELALGELTESQHDLWLEAKGVCDGYREGRSGESPEEVGDEEG